ncbi:MAG: ornithine cyclodeaminase [Pseudomonadota bacterium]
MAAIPVIGPEDVAGRLSWPALVDALAEGHRRPPGKVGDLLLSQGKDALLSRAAWIDGLGIGVKSVTVIPGNEAAGRPTIHGAMLVFDGETGAVRAVVDSALITYWKTAADSVLGARLLARPDAAYLLILGAGTVARSLIEAYPAVLPSLQRISVWNRSATRAAALVEASADARVPVAQATDLSAALAEADIVATATMATAPILRGADLHPGTHVDLIGAFRPDMREADDEVLRRGHLFVDSRETTLDHIGELKDPLARGVIGRDDVLGDLHDLVAGRAGRLDDAAITVFKNGGGAHLDLMTAGVILEAWGG